jgi:hypothetical protein
MSAIWLIPLRALERSSPGATQWIGDPIKDSKHFGIVIDISRNLQVLIPPSAHDFELSPSAA